MKPKSILQIAVLLQIIFACISIYLAYRFLNLPGEPGEFGAMKNFFSGVNGILAILFSLLLILFSYSLLKAKKWAYICSFIFIILAMLVLGASSISALVFEISDGNSLSVTSEILPALLLILLVLSFKNFKKQIHLN